MHSKQYLTPAMSPCTLKLMFSRPNEQSQACFFQSKTNEGYLCDKVHNVPFKITSRRPVRMT